MSLVAAPKSWGGSDDTSFRSSRLDDLEATPLGIEIPSNGPCKLEDAFKMMMEPMDPNSESSACLNPADNNVSTEDGPRVIETELLPVRPALPILVPVSTIIPRRDILVADPSL